MIKYIIIQLSDNAVSYCHYAATATAEPRTIPIEMLHKGITWAMKENATVQFVYPAHRLPDEYHAIIESIDHAKIVPARCDDEQLENVADVVVFDNYADMEGYNFRSTAAYVLRTTRDELFKNHQAITSALGSVQRFNVVITDIDSFTDNDLATYAHILDSLADKVTEQYATGNAVQFNLLTDRIMLDSMNNCNAGWETIALAPDGRFYPCPAFYFDSDEDYCLGDIDSGLHIKNPQLYRLDHAPICRSCDAWQCRRCTWLNRRLTLDVNTPGRQQCVVAHTERNASRRLLARLKAAGLFPGKEIKEITYLDPFEIIKQ